jgi:hypothetical protein
MTEDEKKNIKINEMTSGPNEIDYLDKEGPHHHISNEHSNEMNTAVNTAY